MKIFCHPTQTRLGTYILATVLAYTNEGRLVVDEAAILAAMPAYQCRWLKLRLRLALYTLVRHRFLVAQNSNSYYITTFGRRAMRDVLNREPWLATRNAPCGN